MPTNAAINQNKHASIFVLNDYAKHLEDKSIARKEEPKKQDLNLEVPAVDPLVPTIFHEPWWLDIVTGGDYKVAEVIEAGAVVARLPYFPRKILGATCSLMPQMTHFLGPAVIEGDGNPPTRFLRRVHLTTELIKQLPPAEFYQYKCHRGVTDVIAFQQENFYTSVQFTHEIAPASEEVLWANMRSQKRKKIRQAQQQLNLSAVTDPSEFWHFYQSNLEKRGIENSYDHDVCIKLIQECQSRDRGHIYGVRDKHNMLVAAIFCIWDNGSAYYYMSTRRQDAHQGAISLLAWEAMKDAAKRGLVFDFDGMSNAKGLLFFTEFGGEVSPRYVVTRKTLAGRAAMAVNNRITKGGGSYFSRYFC